MLGCTTLMSVSYYARQRALRHIYIHLIEVRAIYASLVSVFLESRRKKNRMKGIFEVNKSSQRSLKV